MCHGNAWETLLQSIGNVGRVWVPMICLLLAHFLLSFVFGELYNRACAHKYPAINNKGHVLHANAM